MEAILVRVKGLWIDSFALLMGLTIANLTRTKFQFEIVASIMFTDHQTQQSVLWDFALVRMCVHTNVNLKRFCSEFYDVTIIDYFIVYIHP